jgi:hypothetical protein
MFFICSWQSETPDREAILLKLRPWPLQVLCRPDSVSELE